MIGILKDWKDLDMQRWRHEGNKREMWGRKLEEQALSFGTVLVEPKECIMIQ